MYQFVFVFEGHGQCHRSGGQNFVFAAYKFVFVSICTGWFLDALASLKTMFKIQLVTDVFKILTNTRFKECYRV